LLSPEEKEEASKTTNPNIFPPHILVRGLNN